MAADSPGELVEDLASIRNQTREARQAYWLPVGLFGAMACAAAPLYFRPDVTCHVDGPCSYGVAPVIEAPWLWIVGGGVAGLYWALGLLFGALVTIGWYAWFGRVTGLQTRVRIPLVAGTGIIFGVFVAAWVLGTLLDQFQFNRSPVPLLAIGTGLAALGVVERSRVVVIVSAGVCVWAVVVSLYNVENIVFRVQSWFGVADSDMPYGTVSSIQVLVPGVVLLLTALGAFVADLRRR